MRSKRVIGFMAAMAILLLAGWGTGFSALAQQEQPEGEKIPANFTQPFSGFGTLDELSDEGVTIDDSYYPVSRNAGYYDKDGLNLFRSSFKPGNFLGFVLDEEGVIIQLWLLK